MHPASGTAESHVMALSAVLNCAVADVHCCR
ncbi:Ms4533A family Cys-rich leader peptide [Mycolicibacterium hodleri]